MSARTEYPVGVPCWVDRLVANAEPVRQFYAGVLGWEFAGPGPMPDGGEYHVARIDDADVAGIAEAAVGAAGSPGWTTYVAVESVEETIEAATAAGGTVIAGPFEAAPAGRGAVLADPGGAAIGIWEAGERRGAQRVNEPGAWAMSALQSKDVADAGAFYAAAFGWTMWSIPGDQSGALMCRLPGYVGGEPEQPVPRDVVAALIPAKEGPPAWGVDFWIADAQAAADEAEALGGSVVAAPHDAPPFTRTVLADPGGAVFSVSQLRGYKPASD
jgi:predicted enzyme related to lactoylglutathione lyase